MRLLNRARQATDPNEWDIDVPSAFLGTRSTQGRDAERDRCHELVNDGPEPHVSNFYTCH